LAGLPAGSRRARFAAPLGAQPGLDPPHDPRRLGGRDFAARCRLQGLVEGAPDLFRGAHRGDAEPDPLGRVDRPGRRQHLSHERAKEPGFAAGHRQDGLAVLPPGLKRDEAPLWIGDAARPAPRIAGMPLGEAPIGISRERVLARERAVRKKIRSKRLIFRDSRSEMQAKAGGIRRSGRNFRH
jgi:hypothetical protein